MSRRRIVTAPSALALVVALVAAPSASAQTVTVRGQVVGARGYTVVVASSSGAGRGVRLSGRGMFLLRTRATGGLTLSLVAPSGRYWGPVTVRASGRPGVYLTLRARRTVSLGRIVRGRAAAQVSRRLAAPLVDTRRRVRVDRRGVPVGAGRVGFVRLNRSGRMKPAHAVLAQAPAPAGGAASLGADTDGDGIINAYDLDDDGDGILDSSDPDAGAAHNQLGWIFTNTWARDPTDSLNVNAAGVTPAQVDQMVKRDLSVVLSVDTQFALPGETLKSVDVDCFRLAWCATAEINRDALYGNTDGPLLGPWAAYDPNRDGRPNLAPDPRRPDSGIFTMGVYPRAPASDLRPDATIGFHIVTNAGQVDYATTFGPFFVTTPAAARVGSTEIKYPVAPGDPGTGGTGTTEGHPIQLDSFSVPLRIWRPQRLAIQGAESGTFIDMGDLNYQIENPISTDGRSCPASSYSGLTPSLSPSGDGYYEWLADSAEDAKPNPANRIGFTVDFAACAGGTGRLAGQILPLGIDARTSRGENASQKLWVRFPEH